MYKTAADCGHAGAQRRLGEAHENGWFGLEIDLGVALTCYQETAEGGEHYAQRRLGYTQENREFYDEFVLLTDEDEALKWSKKAVAGGDEKA